MGDEGPAVQLMILILVVFGPFVLILGLAVLALSLWEWISIVREREAVERCLRLHLDPVKGIDDLSE